MKIFLEERKQLNNNHVMQVLLISLKRPWTNKMIKYRHSLK